MEANSRPPAMSTDTRAQSSDNPPSLDFLADNMESPVNSRGAPNIPIQSETPTSSDKDFKLFSKFPAEIQQQIFVEAAYAPRCHTVFVSTNHYDGANFDLIAYKNLKHMYGDRMERFTTPLNPRLPIHGEDDRLSISLTCKAAKKAIEIAIKSHPQDWKVIGDIGYPGRGVLFNTATDLAWIVGVKVTEFPRFRGDALDFADLQALHESRYSRLPFCKDDMRRFSGIKKVAIDVPLMKTWMVPGTLNQPVGFSSFLGPVCYLLNHFADLETVYLMDPYWLDKEKQEALSELHSHANDTFFGKVDVDAKQLNAQLMGSRARLPGAIIGANVRYIRKHLLHPTDQFREFDDGWNGPDFLTPEQVATVRKKQEQVDIKYLTWKRVGKKDW